MPKQLTFAQQFEAEYGTDTSCPKNKGRRHEPDWEAVTVDTDGGSFYLDVTCKHCGRSGCVGATKKLEESVYW
jgi:hypothetical protein